MRVEFRITRGSRAGQREFFDKSVITIGRHPLNDLRFDPERDPDASSRHAEIRTLAGKATLHDLASTNGTFVNGRRIAGEHTLADGDVIAFGRDGPAVEFHEAAGSPAPRAAAAPGAAANPRGPATPPAPPRRDTVARIADAVEKQTGTLRRMVVALGGLVVVGAGTAYWVGHRESAQAQARVDALLKRNDSLSAMFEQAVGAMKGKVAGLDSALAASKQETDFLRSQMKDEMRKGSDANVTGLSARLDVAEKRQRALLSAGTVDYESIAAKDGPAIVFIAVEEAGGQYSSASGFNVAPSGLIVTNRHVVQDSLGRPAKRVQVIFDNTHRKWKTAHVLNVSATDELAFIKIDEGGNYPVVVGVSKHAAVRVGTAVAIMGYPLGTGTAGMGGDINALSPKFTLGIGTVSKSLPDTLQFDAYAAQGSSGSPVFDSSGLVIGVLFGGQAESNGRIVYAVPGDKLAAQMPAGGIAIIR
jgi:S1-C subfamily serine protease